MILDNESVWRDEKLAGDVEVRRKILDMASRDINLKRMLILLQERIQYTDTVETCIAKCKEILTPDLFKLIHDWILATYRN